MFYLKIKRKGKKENELNKKFKYGINAIMFLFPPILWIIMLLLDGDYVVKQTGKESMFHVGFCFTQGAFHILSI